MSDSCFTWLQALLPQVIQILHRGKDNANALGVIEGYILLCGNELQGLLQQYLPEISLAIERCVNAVAAAISSAVNSAASRGGDLKTALRKF